ncbi:MAG TPA: hypothetical protein VMV69_16720 [Pirellulales bacterium]|nr:hypothetical protein [Pirellulales bacterium]
MIQSRVVDRQIRLYFQLPAVRTLLGAGDTPEFGTAVQFAAADWCTAFARKGKNDADHRQGGRFGGCPPG